MKLIGRVWQLTQAPYREVLFDTSLQYRRLLGLLPFFYTGAFLATFGTYEVDRTLQPPLDGPLWPLIWTNLLPWEFARIGILALLTVGSLAAICRPRDQWARVMAFVGIFFWLGMIYSHIGVQHRTYTMLTLGFFFALMPNLPQPPESTEDLRRRALLLAFGGMSFVLFTYSWAGMLKIWGIVEALISTNDVVYDFDVVPLHLLNRAYQYQKPLLLSEFVIDHPRLSTLGFFAAIYMEIVSVAAAFRVHLNRWWFALLASFHYLTLFAMGVFFPPATGVLVLLFCFAPFARGTLNWRAVLGELPWFGPFLSAVFYKFERFGGRKGRHWVNAAPDCYLAQALIAYMRQADQRSDVSFEGPNSEIFMRLIEEYPSHCEGRGLLVLSEHQGERRVRFDSEAALYISAGMRGRLGWAFLLLTIPLPLTQPIYRALARQMRIEQSSHSADSTSG